MPSRTLRLTEYRPSEVRLRRADVDALLADPRKPIEVVPTRERAGFRLTAQGFAGILHTPNVRLVLRPKVPAANLYMLLDPDAPPEIISDRSAVEPGTEAIGFLARRVADDMRRRAALGLSRGYVERSDQQPFLQGRLDVAAQVRESPAARTHFHTTRDEFSADLPIHRLAQATAQALLTSPFVGGEVRAMLRTALIGYAEVSSPSVDAAPGAIAVDRLPRPTVSSPTSAGCSPNPCDLAKRRDRSSHRRFYSTWHGSSNATSNAVCEPGCRTVRWKFSASLLTTGRSRRSSRRSSAARIS
jgi:hypothetical protein